MTDPLSQELERSRKRKRLAALALGLLALPFAALPLLESFQGAGGPTRPNRAVERPTPEQRIRQGVSGFLSARFGMTRREVQDAIRSDFDIAPGRIVRGAHATERTNLLAVKASDPVAGVGPGIVTYVFGFRSDRLIQVNVAWGADAGQIADPAALRSKAEALRAWLEGVGVALTDVALHRPGAARTDSGAGGLLYHGDDKLKRMAAISLVASSGGEARADTLRLSLAENARSPDIFRLKPQSF